MSDDTRTERLIQALSDAGAQCGVCGDEPGDRSCPDCERVRARYVEVVRGQYDADIALMHDALHQAAREAFLLRSSYREELRRVRAAWQSARRRAQRRREPLFQATDVASLERDLGDSAAALQEEVQDTYYLFAKAVAELLRQGAQEAEEGGPVDGAMAAFGGYSRVEDEDREWASTVLRMVADRFDPDGRSK